MATHSSVLAWRIPGSGEPGGLLSVGSRAAPRIAIIARAAFVWPDPVWGAGDTVVNNICRISALVQFTIYQGQANLYQGDWL